MFSFSELNVSVSMKIRKKLWADSLVNIDSAYLLNMIETGL